MTGCEAIRELSQSYLDGALAPEECERLERHLRGCPACRRVMATYRLLYSALAAPAIPTAPPWLVTATLARVRGAARRRRVLQALVMAAALFVVVSSVSFLAWGGLLEAIPTSADVAASVASWRAAVDAASGLAGSLTCAAGDLAGSVGAGGSAAAVLAVALAAQLILAYRWRRLASLEGSHSIGGPQ